MLDSRHEFRNGEMSICEVLELERLLSPDYWAATTNDELGVPWLREMNGGNV